MTEFQQRVYSALMLIPKGKVTTYKHLARYISCNSAQAIGQALKRNLNAPEVPCHRVVKSDLSIGGYNGHTRGDKIDQKIAYLQAEGVSFHHGKVMSYCVFTFQLMS
ncbi:MGMT family protein [Caedibacter taeniospiralis]|uniref:MGMT family protein n=1 Tax=Caedibacter taeniospiralis TaxID=28907 RepID=UPI000C26DE02|nr:MGMT family protein [Caedibacter taeniospiralis]